MMAGVVAATFLSAGLLISVTAQGEIQASDPAATYKTKCVACHGQKAEKKFDSTLPDEQLIDISNERQEAREAAKHAGLRRQRCYRGTGEGAG